MTRQTPRAPRRLIWAGLFALVAACGGPSAVEERGAVQLPGQARRVLTTALDQIQDRYVRVVDVGALVESGLASVARIDTALQIRRNGDTLEIEGGDGDVSRVTAIAPSAAAWGNATVIALEAGRARSATLRGLSADATYKLFLDGVMKNLDSYSRYNTPESAREERAQREGFGGIGVTIDTESGGVRIANVMDDSPAARAGLQVDDRIITIEGETTTGMTSRDVVRRLRGTAGEPVAIEFTRAAVELPLRVALVRAHIVPQTVVYRRAGDVAHIRISGFNPKTTESLVDAVRRAETEIGPRFAGIVLDLRNNFGGYLDQSIYVSDLFLHFSYILLIFYNSWIYH